MDKARNGFYCLNLQFSGLENNNIIAQAEVKRKSDEIVVNYENGNLYELIASVCQTSLSTKKLKLRLQVNNANKVNPPPHMLHRTHVESLRARE